MRAAVYTAPGSRQINQDNFYLNGHLGAQQHTTLAHTALLAPFWRKGVFGVFDGVGGGVCGEEASYLATTHTKIFSGHKPFADLAQQYTNCCNQAICERRIQYGYQDMGSTAVILSLTTTHANVYHVGDSVCYLLRGGVLSLITAPHQRESTLYQRVILDQYLGLFPYEKQVAPSTQTITLQKGDLFLLCTDGISTQLTTTDIEHALRTHASVSRLVETLVAQAVQKERSDNVTALAVKL